MPFSKAKKKSRAGYKYGYRSGFEKETNDFLKEHLNQPIKYEAAVIHYTVPASNHKYTPDFKLQKKKNGVMYIETKGRWVTADRKKMKLIKEQHPDIDIRLVFQNPNQKIRKGSKTTYGMWADKLGIPWAKKILPDAWLKELK